MANFLNDQKSADFAPGMMVRHLQNGYLGLVYDVDPVYCQSEEYFEMMPGSKPRKNSPWYHVLVDGETHTTYVAEENLELCGVDERIDHPLITSLFSDVCNNQYQMRQTLN